MNRRLYCWLYGAWAVLTVLWFFDVIAMRFPTYWVGMMIYNMMVRVAYSSDLLSKIREVSEEDFQNLQFPTWKQLGKVYQAKHPNVYLLLKDGDFVWKLAVATLGFSILMCIAKPFYLLLRLR